MMHSMSEPKPVRNTGWNGWDAALSVVEFWRAAKAHWFAKDGAFDRTFHDRFIELHLAVTSRLHDDWIGDPASQRSALALALAHHYS